MRLPQGDNGGGECETGMAANPRGATGRIRDIALCDFYTPPARRKDQVGEPSETKRCRRLVRPRHAGQRMRINAIRLISHHVRTALQRNGPLQ